MPAVQPKSLLGSAEAVDIRIWRRDATGEHLLLAHAPKRTGNAVLRNRFRRRTRMAFFQVLGEITPSLPLVVWVRPSRQAPLGCRIPFDLLVGQIRLALSRFQARQA